MHNPCDIKEHARTLLIEEIMALLGRSMPNPLKFREMLEGRSLDTLSRLRDGIIDGYDAATEEKELTTSGG